ncbi:MAG: 3'-5' exonuclease [Anaerotruncus massiliensis (ex Togo et al. 2019)]
MQAGAKYSDHAVLYRMNAQSQMLERGMVKAGIPYRIIGGLRFYERKEIKDIVSYLSVLSNRSDSLRLRRIINEPKRKIGDSTVNAVAEIAAGRARRCSIAQRGQTPPSGARPPTSWRSRR